MIRKRYLLSGPVRSGKTTALSAWAAGQKNLGGLLTPDGPDGRIIQNLSTGEYHPLEASEADADVITIGRFRFSKKAFDLATSWLLEAASSSSTIIIDEVGPLELRGEGFATVLRELSKYDGTIILLVRTHLVTEVIREFFKEEHPKVVQHPNEILL